MPRPKGSINTSTLLNKQPKSDRYIGRLKVLTENGLKELQNLILVAKDEKDYYLLLKVISQIMQHGHKLFVDEEAKRLQELTDKVNELLKAQQKAENKVNKTFSRVASVKTASKD